MKTTKIQAIKQMEANGLAFTANVLMNGCSAPTAKMKTILKLIDIGCEVRHAPYETCAVVVDGVYVSFFRLGVNFDELLSGIRLEKAGL